MLKIKKIIALSLCTILLAGTASALSGCGKKEGKESASSAVEKVYGLHMKENRIHRIAMLYDSEFVTDDEAETLYKYYSSLEEKDAQTFASLMPDAYIDFLSKQNGQTATTMMKNIYNELEDTLGPGFKFDYIDITDSGTEETESGIREVIEMMDSIYEEQGEKKKFSETLKSAKYVRFDISVKAGTSYLDKDNQMFYLFTTDDGIYII